jgi:hypothetical protein
MDSKDIRIKELEERLSIYEGNPSASFYSALIEGIEYITKEVKNKTLDLKEDAFASSVLVLSEKADKVFIGIEKGLAMFSPDSSEPSVKGKKIKDLSGAAI